MYRIALILLLAVVTPAFAYDRTGYVMLETRGALPGSRGQARHLGQSMFNEWEYTSAWPNAYPWGWQLTIKPIPFTGPGHFIEPAQNEVVFHFNQTVSVWDGTVTGFLSPSKGYRDIFTDDMELTEIAPMRSGHFLVAERSADRSRGASVIEFSLQGRITDHVFPELLDSNGRALGASHIELAADQCTLMYTLGSDDPEGGRIRRMNICNDTAESDFATLLPGQYAGAIRQLADGTVIAADGSAILRFAADGSLFQSYEFPGVTHLALTPDGTAFWAAGVNLGTEELRYFGDGSTIRLGNASSQSGFVAEDVSDLVVVGEWRAAVSARQRVAH